MNLLKYLNKNQKGFSLVELIVGGSIIAGVSMAGFSLYNDHFKAQSKIEALVDLENFHRSLNQSLQSVPDCNATIQKIVPGSGSTKVPASDIKSIYFCSSNCTDQKLYAEVTSEATPRFTESKAKPTDGSQWIDAKKEWEITELAITNPLSTSGVLNVHVIYTLKPKSNNPIQVRKIIPLNVKFTKSAPFTFVSCGSDKEANIRTANLDLCDALAGTSATGKMVQWSEQLQKCVVLSNPKSCAENEMYFGFDATGNNLCHSITEGVDASPLYNTAEVNCLGEKIPQVSVTSDGKLQVSCK